MASSDDNGSVTISTYLKDLKSNISCWDEIAIKSQKLNASLKASGQSASNLIDSVGQLCSNHQNSLSGTDKVTQLLSEVTVIERYMVEKMAVMNRAVQEELVNKLPRETEMWRRFLSSMKRERAEGGRRARDALKKAMVEVTRLESVRGGVLPRETRMVQAEFARRDRESKASLVAEMERCVLRRVVREERRRIGGLADALKPLMEAQLAMRDDLDRLAGVYEALYGNGGACESLRDDVSELGEESSHNDSFLSRSSSQCLYLAPGAHSSASSVLDESSSTLQGHEDEHLDEVDRVSLVSSQSSSYRYSSIKQLKAVSRDFYDHLGQQAPINTFWDEQQPQLQQSRLFHGRDSSSCYGSYGDHSDGIYGTGVVPQPQHYHQHHQPHRQEQIYGGSLMLLPSTSSDDSGHYGSGTSTFKRRKPSTVTAMETPSITNVNRHSMDVSNLTRYPSESTILPLYQQQQYPISDLRSRHRPGPPPRQIGDCHQFKQQLLQVIQGGR